MLGKRYHHGHIADFVRMRKRNGVLRPKGTLTTPRPYIHVTHVAVIIRACATILSPNEGIVTSPGRTWAASQTADLLRFDSIEGPAPRPADPEVDAFIDGDATEWVKETIDWCLETIT